jgi:uncharacterized C2H2 Zn-finger protein
MNRRPLWKCPRCGERFVTANTWHSCGRHSLKQLFARAEPNVRRMYRKLARMVRTCGRVRVIPQRTRLVFMTRVRFVAVYPRKKTLEIGIELPERDPHPRFHKIETYTRRMHGHYLRVENESQLDGQVQRWLCRAYATGAQRPAPSPRKRPMKSRQVATPHPPRPRRN